MSCWIYGKNGLLLLQRIENRNLYVCELTRNSKCLIIDACCCWWCILFVIIYVFRQLIKIEYSCVCMCVIKSWIVWWCEGIKLKTLPVNPPRQGRWLVILRRWWWKLSLLLWSEHWYAKNPASRLNAMFSRGRWQPTNFYWHQLHNICIMFGVWYLIGL